MVKIYSVKQKLILLFQIIFTIFMVFILIQGTIGFINAFIEIK
jgi:hypothetical protein